MLPLAVIEDNPVINDQLILLNKRLHYPSPLTFTDPKVLHATMKLTRHLCSGVFIDISACYPDPNISPPKHLAWPATVDWVLRFMLEDRSLRFVFHTGHDLDSRDFRDLPQECQYRYIIKPANISMLTSAVSYVVEGQDFEDDR
jgi:hypothetical protein